MERIKLIWDFRGPNSLPTAQHHIIHLKEFAAVEGLENCICLTEQVSNMHSMAIMIVDKKHMNDLRERLKPHRGQLHTE